MLTQVFSGGQYVWEVKRGSGEILLLVLGARAEGGTQKHHPRVLSDLV